MEKAFFARIFALPQWQRRGEKRRGRGGGKGGEGWRERYLGDVRVKSLCCSRCYPVSPFQESRIMRSIVPECCFCGRYGSSCATSYSWNVFAYSLVRISTSLPALFYLSRVKARMSKLQNTNYRPIFKTRISTSILARRLIGIFGKYRIILMLNEIKIKKFPILRDRIERLASFN